MSDSGRRVGFDLARGRMAGIAFGDEARPPEVLFLHATGLNALTYRDMLAPLGKRFHVVAVDLRGHGRTTLPAPVFGYASWNRHRDDVIELLGRHFPTSVTLAGHSMGATVSLLVAGARADLTRGLCLIDAVMLPRSVLSAAPGASIVLEHTIPIARAARRRRDRFATRQEAMESLVGRGFFRTWPNDVLADYLEDGLVETPQGGFRLACRRAYEARTFAAHRYNAWAALATAPGPIVMLRAEKDSTTPEAAARRIAALRPDARLATVEGTTHALPMERPDRVRAAIETATLVGGGGDRLSGFV